MMIVEQLVNEYQLLPNICKMNIKRFVKWVLNTVVTRGISFLKYTWLAVLNLFFLQYLILFECMQKHVYPTTTCNRQLYCKRKNFDHVRSTLSERMAI